MESLKRSLILAGGGTRVAWQAGVLLALEEAGLSFDHADGTSGGTINLAMMLSGLSPTQMMRRWETLPVREFISLMPLQKYLSAEGMEALGDARGIVEKVFPHLGIDIAAIRSQQRIAGTFNVCNFSRKVSEVISHDRLTLAHLVAGISLPIFMPAVHIEGCDYFDSVWIRDANLMEAVRRGADELWLVWCIGNTPKYHSGLFRQYVHMIETAANGALFLEFEQINDINRRIESGEVVLGHTRPIRLHVIRPEYPLPLDPDYYMGRIDARTLAGLGYTAASRYLARRSPQGVAFSAEVTQMSEPTLGFTFREKMAGGFSLGETDPHSGAVLGRDTGNTCTLHATIDIHDLNGFLAESNHPGSLTATIDFPPLGLNMPSTAGVFKLFSPTQDPSTKYMVYEAGFRVGDKAYYLAGHKDVKKAALIDLWSATTTLYTQLHEGTDSSGPVVGAGILTLGVTDLMAMIPTMHATDASSPAEAAEANVRFGKFFLGELWDTYVKR